MNEILDEILKPNMRKTFSILSFVFGLLATLILIFSFVLSSHALTIKEASHLQMLEKVAQLFCLFGLISTFISFTNKEPFSKLKLIGIILNGITFLIFAVAIFSRLIDNN